MSGYGLDAPDAASDRTLRPDRQEAEAASPESAAASRSRRLRFATQACRRVDVQDTRESSEEWMRPELREKVRARLDDMLWDRVEFARV